MPISALRSRTLLRWWLAIAVVLALARLGRAEVTQDAAQALAWQADKQRNELQLATELRAVFDNDAQLVADVRDYARAVIGEIVQDLDKPGGDDVARRLVDLKLRGINDLNITDAKGNPKASVLAWLHAVKALHRVPVGLLGDVLWMHNHCLAAQPKDPRTAEMFAAQRGIGGIPARYVWNEVLAPGRLRVRHGANGFDGTRHNNLEGDAGAVAAQIHASCKSCALRFTALAPGSVLGRMERAYGLTMGADISGSTNVYLWQLKHFQRTDPIWQLVPIVTMVADWDHTLLEVALVLDSWGYTRYQIGDYRTLLGPSTHPSAAAVWGVLQARTSDPRNHHMYCWYGEGTKVTGCRRSAGNDLLPPIDAVSAYVRLFVATIYAGQGVADANPLNPYGLPKSDALLAPGS